MTHADHLLNQALYDHADQMPHWAPVGEEHISLGYTLHDMFLGMDDRTILLTDLLPRTFILRSDGNYA